MSIERFNRLMEMATGYWQAGAINAAVAVGLFEAVDAQPGTTAQEIAEAAKLSPAHVTALLDALTGMGLIDNRGDRYAIAGEYREYLSPSGERCALDAMRFNADLYLMWSRLGDCVRSGQAAAPGVQHLGADPAHTRRFVMGMHSRALGLAEAIVPAVDLSGRQQLLDVGAGPGTFSRLMAERYTGLRVTLFDLPGVLDVTRELVKSDRMTLVAGDYRKDELPGGHDTIFYCGALHQETRESAKALFSRILAALEPRGRVIVVDLMLDDGRTGPTFAALFSIQMKLLNPTAGVFTVADVRGLLDEVGFKNIADRRLDPTAYQIMQADKS